MTFSEKNATCKKGIQPQLLPPTEEAARQHSYCVYLQISDWKCFDSVLHPLDWGWYIGDDAEFHPVANLKAPAPDDILKVICCKCKSTSKNQCGTNLCSCHKSDLACVSACGGCHGVGCNNSGNKPDADDLQEFDDYVEDSNDGNIFEKLFL